ncbi:putative basic amino acid antiporter YfcC [Sedimentibacter hydroxybenzoicus DSM 7310]|uniref:Basic amino acid antiporter YfcC n=1 Tax=Sedimentibacter hydroxybenzoicus DSM 7310 TaxID=1123245 RepID=A0A974BJ03_SEDHY|nr:Na+/H+ antiporter NhaC family protein [Sedimentibacter hydroxybenzoicus]NYB73992.1 putative basic amino acid antiporter YfcC [Sedimentibacter hydroxybenzoicus DSM 7310]
MTSSGKKGSFLEGLKKPNGYVIIFTLILTAMILTWLIPSGSYERVVDEASGRTVVDAESFKLVEDKTVNIFGMLKAIPKGISASGGIIAFIFIISGSVEVIRGTGALDAVIIHLVEKMKGKDTILLVLVTIIFTLLGAVFGFAEETIPFIPLVISMCLALGYDRVVGFHVVRTAAWVGFAGAFLNPFTIGVAQSIAELPMFSGLLFRIICYVVFLVIGLWFILSYAKKVKKDPTKSIIYGYEGDKDARDFEIKDVGEFTARHKLVLVVFALNIIFLIFGVIKYGWYTTELSALFLGFAMVAGFVGGFSPNEIFRYLTKGMSGVTFGALIVGFARAIVIILEEGMILDTIVFGLSQPIMGLSSSIAAAGMFIIQSFINFFIGSGSGQAAATMPIMIPLSDVLGITRQTAVLAFQFGDGITNMLWPAMIYYLAFADIPYNAWFKHILKLTVILTVAGIILVSVAQMISYGPF